MSAPAALRAPAGTWRIARHYLEMVGRDGAGWTALLAAMLVAQDRPYLVLYAGKAEFLLLLFFLPLGQRWLAGGDRAVLDAAMPLDRVRHGLVRVACGAAWAAAALGAGIALAPLDIEHKQGIYELRPGETRADLPAWYPPDGVDPVQFPAWYPLAFFAAGLTWYLLGSAVLLRAGRPGRALLLVAVLIGVAIPLLPPGAGARLMVAYGDPAELARLSTPEWLGSTVLALGLACALVYAALRIDPQRIRAPRRTAARPPRRLAGRAARARVPGTRLRHTPSSAAVAWRHFVLLRHRMAWPLLVALLLAWRGMRQEMAAGRTIPHFFEPGNYEDWSDRFVLAAVLWPVLVWMDERGPGREEAEALPVGTTRTRILHAAAGAAWLLAALLVVVAGNLGGAIAAGTLARAAAFPAWLWLGLPCCVLTIYLVGTPTAVLSEHPIMLGFVAWLVVEFGYLWEAPLAPMSALYPVGTRAPMRWSLAAGTLWLVLCAAAAAAAVALAAWRDRHGRFPDRYDVRRYFRGSPGTASTGRPA